MTDRTGASGCTFRDQDLITPQLLLRMGIAPADLYQSEAVIAAIARQARLEGGHRFAVLPFCHTTEAAALGAHIQPADEWAGPRPGRYACTSLDQMQVRSIVRDPVIVRLLSACRTLRGEGIPVVYPITGPISILSCLMDLSVLFKAWRREPEETAALWEGLRGVLLELTEAVRDAGASVLSYADPAGNEDILGPRCSRLLAQAFTLPFLRAAARRCGAELSLIICPLTAKSLAGMGALEPAPAGQGGLACGCIKSAHPSFERRLRLASD